MDYKELTTQGRLDVARNRLQQLEGEHWAQTLLNREQAVDPTVGRQAREQTEAILTAVEQRIRVQCEVVAELVAELEKEKEAAQREATSAAADE